MNRMPKPHRLLPLFAAIVAATLLIVLLASPATLAAQHPYRVLDRWKLGGDGGWDYLLVDSPAHRLYLTRGNHVDAVDTRSGKLIGSIGGLHGTHGVALDTAGKFGYISDGGGNAIVVFDRATLATVATVPAGANPDSIVFDPATQSVWAFNGRSKDVTVLDAATNKVTATIPLPGKPEFAVTDGKGLIYDNIEDLNEIVRLDARSLKLTATWTLAECDGPSGLALDNAGERLFSVCDGKKMAVTDAKNGKPVATASIGSGPDAAGWDAADKLAFASCGEGILSVIDASAPGYPTIESLPTQAGARTMAYDPATDRIYLVSADFGPRPEPTAANPRPRPPIIPGSFTVLIVGR